MSASDDSGLNLINETASAAGNFPGALRGYDRSSVDEYVHTIERQLVETRRQRRDLANEVETLKAKVTELHKALSIAEEDPDFAEVGARAADILRVAEEQAKEIVDKAELTADRARESGRREEVAARRVGEKDAADLRMAGMAEIAELRRQLEQQTTEQVEHAKAEAASLLAAGQREAEAFRRQAEHATSSTQQTAQLEIAALRQSAEKDAAQIRQQIAAEREVATEELRTTHSEAVAATSALLAEATQHHEQSRVQLAEDVAAATKIRTDALAEAERTKVRAARETEQQIANARAQAASIQERSAQQFAWHKEQLRRETDLLGQRKAAILAQLASLSELAQQSAAGFPNTELPDLGDASDFEAEIARLGSDPKPPAANGTAANGTATNGTADTRTAATGTGYPDDDDETRVLPAVTTKAPDGPKAETTDTEADRSMSDTQVLEPVTGERANANTAAAARDTRR